MKKIPSLFKRDYEKTRLVYDEVVSGSEWVLNGEGWGTRKWDGTAAMIRGGRLYKRYDVKKGRTVPADFEPAQDPDPKTGHWPGWVPVGGRPEDRWFREARQVWDDGLPDGTYELCGPKVNGNPEGFDEHLLIPHGAEKCDPPRDFDGLCEWFKYHDLEGVVWYHPDGRMVKIKAKDFGVKRPR